MKSEGKARYGEQYRMWQQRAADFEIDGKAPVRCGPASGKDLPTQTHSGYILCDCMAGASVTIWNSKLALSMAAVAWVHLGQVLGALPGRELWHWVHPKARLWCGAWQAAVAWVYLKQVSGALPGRELWHGRTQKQVFGAVPGRG